MAVLVKHDGGCPTKGLGHSDAAQRIYDAYHLHRTADIYGAIGKWIACALNDGRSDGVAYASRKEAILHQHHNEMYYTYLQITPANLTVCAAETMLSIARRMYDAGLRITDPVDARREPIKRVSAEDENAFAQHGLVTGLTWPQSRN